VRRLSEQSLANAALFYLRRYSASRKGLAQVLERKVKRLIREKGGDLEAAQALIEQVVNRMVTAGYIDDSRLAEAKSASLHRQGKSARMIRLKLRQKGIEAEQVAKATVTTPEREFEAALTLVKKKRLGQDPERRQKDLAVLMRAGFGYDIAKRCLAKP
jgi:regulatory protein